MIPPHDVAPLLVAGAVFVFLLVTRLLRHQREMAKIIHGSRTTASEDGLQRMSSELEQLRAEVARLTALEHQHAIAQDDVRNQLSRIGEAPVVAPETVVTDRQI